MATSLYERNTVSGKRKKIIHVLHTCPSRMCSLLHTISGRTNDLIKTLCANQWVSKSTIIPRRMITSYLVYVVHTDTELGRQELC